MKKTLIFLSLFILFVAIFIGAWWFLMRGGEETPATDTGDSNGQTFNPFGIFGNNDGPTDTTVGSDNTSDGFQNTGTQGTTLLTLISERGVAGSVFTTITNGTSTKTVLRYAEKETGHIVDYVPADGSRNRISNTTIPRVREVVWGNNGSSVALRYLGEDESIETFLGTIATSGTAIAGDSLLSGSFLPKNALSLAIHPKAPKTFYVLKTDNGSSGYLVENGTTKTVFSHPFSQWHAAWSGTSSVLLTTSPSYQINGASFLLDIKNGSFRRVETGVPALTALPNQEGSLILFGGIGQSGMTTFVHDTEKQEKTPLLVRVLPEKCVWTGDRQFYCGLSSGLEQRNLPDNWYQGVLSFSDEIWKVDPTTTITEYILNTNDYMADGADIIDIHLSADERFLSFINKKDGSLWLADLSRVVPDTAETDLDY